MTYRWRVLVIVGIDSLIVLSAIFIGAFLLYDVSGLRSELFVATAIVLVIAHHVFAYIFKMYKGAWAVCQYK